MKIYVDGELPKCCRECGFCCKDDLGCCCQGLGDGGVYILDEILKEKRLNSCPLETTQSLKQQVRAEVVEETRAELNKQKLVMKSDFHPREEEAIPWQDIVAILDQVKGETK